MEEEIIDLLHNNDINSLKSFLDSSYYPKDFQLSQVFHDILSNLDLGDYKINDATVYFVTRYAVDLIIMEPEEIDEILLTMIEKGDYRNFTKYFNHTNLDLFLFNAVFNGSTQNIRFLIELGAKCSVLSGAAVRYCLQKGDVKLAKELVELGTTRVYFSKVKMKDTTREARDFVRELYNSGILLFQEDIRVN